MANFIDLLVAKCEDGSMVTFAVPISTAHKGDMILCDGALWEIVCKEWVSTDSPIYKVMRQANQILTPEKVLSVKWDNCPAIEESEDTNADS